MRCEMKKYFISVLILISAFGPAFIVAQINIAPVRISPEIGDTINLDERNYYNLFPEIRGFESATIYQGDSTTIAKIIFVNDKGILKDTIFSHPRDYTGNLTASIRQINVERLDNYNSIDKITVTKLDGNEYIGKLLAVQDSSFIICPDTITNACTFNFIKTYIKMNSQEVESVLLQFGYWSDAGTAASIGGIVGLCIGGFIGGSQPVQGGLYSGLTELSNTFYGGLLGMLAGATLGFGLGLILATPDETIEINSAADIELLKEYLPY